MWLSYLYVFLAILLGKIALNWWRYSQCKAFLRFHQETSEHGGWKAIENSLQIVSLLKSAGVEDAEVTEVQEPIPGSFQTLRVSVFRNIASRRPEIGNVSIRMVHEAMGAYRARILEAINPLYWLETMVFLPRRVLDYLGVRPDNVASKILQVLYWIAIGVWTLLRQSYGPQIDAFLRTLFSNPSR